jgi:RNA polymerase sigma-70 factor (sigma-E family)
LRICVYAGMPSGGRLAGVFPSPRSAGEVTSTEEFVEFAEAASPRLRRTAFLLCGDWHTAEDLAQSALAKVFVSWRRIRRRDAAYAYATRTLVNLYLADKRVKRIGEVLMASVPERAADETAAETRLVVDGLLASLPPKARAVVVLRYWADLSIEQAAEVLRCSPGNVKSQSARALDKLRIALDQTGADPGSPGHVHSDRREMRGKQDG